ncbi:hypothetical protein [Streptomyces sp. NBC_01546]|uniref:hypothetical protein n=1 Tax=Streptomyces sp. NBC_01546 TaxID=2975872 RepID=UPI00386C9A61
MTVEQLSHVDTGFLQQVEDASRRYATRTTERDGHMEALEQHGILYADTQERVNNRLNRLGVDWAMATAIERTPETATTGTSLDLDRELVSTDLLVLERFMGRNDLIGIDYLEGGFLAARSVGRITVRSPGSSHHGTGFLVSPSLMGARARHPSEGPRRGCLGRSVGCVAVWRVLTDRMRPRPQLLVEVGFRQGSQVVLGFRCGADSRPVTPRSVALLRALQRAAHWPYAVPRQDEAPWVRSLRVTGAEH